MRTTDRKAKLKMLQWFALALLAAGLVAVLPEILVRAVVALKGL